VIKFSLLGGSSLLGSLLGTLLGSLLATLLGGGLLDLLGSSLLGNLLRGSGSSSLLGNAGYNRKG
jgi:hypothetical protein